MKINVIGAGLAGCEASYYLAKKGYDVNLYEMRPKKNTEAHQTNLFAELVCSNSLKNNSLTNACGLLKEEIRYFDSLLLKVASKTSVPAGEALAVSRDDFANEVTKIIKNTKNITIINEEVTNIDLNVPTIIATGPLTSNSLSDNLIKLLGEEKLFFYDAQAPIIYYDSINMDICYFKSRYDKGDASYINCPFTKEQFELFYSELINAKIAKIEDFDLEFLDKIKVFEGCMPIEVMARRGIKTLTFGPLKPVGLDHNGKKFYAVLQLRQDDLKKTLYNMVGFQTHLTDSEQKRVFRLIPGLENARFLKYGRMHKNTYINAYKSINKNLQTLKYKNLFIAGQLCGVEGYVESMATGLLAAINMDLYLRKKDMLNLDSKTILGSLVNYITSYNKDPQPINANFGIIDDLDCVYKKDEKKELLAKRSIDNIKRIKEEYGI